MWDRLSVNARTERGARAAARLAVAHQIIDDLDLLERWKPYGEPVLVGSVAVNLVVRPDIDLEIHADTPTVAAGFEVAAALAELPNVRGIRYKDERRTPEQGLYWKVEYVRDGTEFWTIDMWLFGRDHPGPTAAPLIGALRSALTDDTRDTILAIKEEATAQGARAYGHWLYRAVLNNGVRSYAEFLTWLGNRDVWDRMTWHPRRA